MERTQIRYFGTPLKPGAIKVLLLGSGELGKELVIEHQRLGVEVIACDRYNNAPAMQVAHRFHVFDMLDRKKLREIVALEQPDLIVPEVEAIATDELLALEGQGYQVTPNARATKLTMDREGIRRLAAEELGLETARYQFADTYDELEIAAKELGYPCVIKPIMSSSGKGQSLVTSQDELRPAWNISQQSGRSGAGRVILEEFVKFESEITLLTVRTRSETLFCDPIGHRQEKGDYVESWQPHKMEASQLSKAQHIAKAVTDNLGGLGLFGVELFLTQDGRVLFSEVSPRPHDTGMVTLATQPLSEFALHARAILGLPIPRIERFSAGASVAVKAEEDSDCPNFSGLEACLAQPDVDIRLFAKPTATTGRRMAVVVARSSEVSSAIEIAKNAKSKLKITTHQ